MRSLISAVLGYLAIGATLTLAKNQQAQSLTQVCTGGSCKNFLIASCKFGSNGQVVFREPQFQEGTRLVQTQSHRHDDDCDETDRSIYKSDDFDEDEERRRKGVESDPRLTGEFDFKNLEKNT